MSVGNTYRKFTDAHEAAARVARQEGMWTAVHDLCGNNGETLWGVVPYAVDAIPSPAEIVAEGVIVAWVVPPEVAPR